VAVSALRFLYRVTLKKDWPIEAIIPRPKPEGHRPLMLSRDEVRQLLDAVVGHKHRVILTLCYAAGLRGAVPTDILHFLVRVVVTSARPLSIVLDELSGVMERPMIVSMPTTARPQQRYDHRLRNLVQRTGDVTVATDLGVPRSTARGWLGAAPTVVVCLDVAHDLTEPELRQEVLKLRRRVQKLTALLRLAVALLRSSGVMLTHQRLPDGRAKTRILSAVDRAREFVPLRALLRFLRLSPSRFHAWRRLQHACALDDQSSCPRTSPHRLTQPDPAELSRATSLR